MKRVREKINRPHLTKLDFDIAQTPFNIWLKNEKQKDPFELKESKKQKYFEKFRNLFNDDQLDLKYYEIYERETTLQFNEIEIPKPYEEIQYEKKLEKAYIKQRKEDLEELVPKPDPGSFLAKKQKNKAKYYREDSPDPGDSTYDDSMKQFQQMLQKQKNKKLEKEIEIEKRIQEIKEKERLKMEEFKKQINLKKFNTNK